MKEETKAFLNKHGKQIGKQAREGNVCAQRIIEFYTMYYHRPELIALAFLEAAIADYQEQMKGDSK